MIKMITFLKRHPSYTREEFQKHWLEHHGPLVSSVPECSRYMRRYIQNHPVSPESELGKKASAAMGPALPSGEMDFDGIVEVWYDSIEDLQKSSSSQEFMDTIRVDELKFADPPNCVVFIVEEHTIFDEENRPAAELAAT